MNVNDIIDKKLEQRVGELKNQPIKVYLPDMGINYLCDPEKVPVFLNPIRPCEIHNYREGLAREIFIPPNRRLENWPWNYKRGSRLDHDYDSVIDIIHIKSDLPGNLRVGYPRFDLFIGYHTKPNNEFLTEFVPRYLEIMMLSETRMLAVSDRVVMDLNEIIDKYLKKLGTSLNEFKDLKDSFELKESYEGSGLPKTYREIDFIYLSRTYLGILASMDKTLKITPEEYFLNLRKADIFPLKRIGDGGPIFNLIERELTSKNGLS